MPSVLQADDFAPWTESPSAFHRKDSYSPLFWQIETSLYFPFPKRTEVNTALTTVSRARCVVPRFLWGDASLVLTSYSLSSKACCWLAVPRSSARCCTARGKTPCHWHCHQWPRDKDLWLTKHLNQPREWSNEGHSHFFRLGLCKIPL